MPNCERRASERVEPPLMTNSAPMALADNVAHKAAAKPIDVLAFPPDAAELQRQQTMEARCWHELERRARVALFFGAGMFLAWAADVGAAFEIAHESGSALFGAASIPLAVTVVVAHLYGQWAFERAARGAADVKLRYSDVTLREARPLLDISRGDEVIAQYLRCVGRQQRALLRVERAALYAWMNGDRVKRTGAD